MTNEPQRTSAGRLGSLGTTSNPQQQTINKGVKDLCEVSKDKNLGIIFEKKSECIKVVRSL